MWKILELILSFVNGETWGGGVREGSSCCLWRFSRLQRSFMRFRGTCWYHYHDRWWRQQVRLKRLHTTAWHQVLWQCPILTCIIHNKSLVYFTTYRWRQDSVNNMFGIFLVRCNFFTFLCVYIYAHKHTHRGCQKKYTHFNFFLS